MTAKPRKRVRRELDLKQKVLFIRDASDNPKPTQKLLGEKCGVGTSTVSDILKKKDSYHDQFETNSDCKKKLLKTHLSLTNQHWS